MAKLLTVFSLVSGGCSIAGLYLALEIGHVGYGLSAIFLMSLALTAYVLLVPNSVLERNVRSKVQSYEPQGDASQLVIQRGEIALDTSGEAGVEYHEPFAEPPTVELVFKSGSHDVQPQVSVVTAHQATFRPFAISWPAKRAVFTWIARGTPLKEKSKNNE